MNVHYLPLATPPVADTRPDALCAYCWPKLIVADFWDDNGHACCVNCGCNWNRECRMPKFAMRDAR